MFSLEQMRDGLSIVRIEGVESLHDLVNGTRPLRPNLGAA